MLNTICLQTLLGTLTLGVILSLVPKSGAHGIQDSELLEDTPSKAGLGDDEAEGDNRAKSGSTYSSAIQVIDNWFLKGSVHVAHSAP